jgi:hypothetical protein
MLHAIEMGWYVLNKYYTMSDTVPVYAAALLLDPSKRKAYIDQNWPSEWHDRAISAARTIWEEEYNTTISIEPQPHPSNEAASTERNSNQLQRLLQSVKVKPTISRNVDSFDTFINDPPIDVEAMNCTPLEWWCLPEQRRQYPRLSRMAIDILSIAPESADPERAFSGARRTCSWDRLRLTVKNIEMVECVGNWLREGHIIKAYKGGLGLICDPEVDGNDIMDVDDEIDD